MVNTIPKQPSKQLQTESINPDVKGGWQFGVMAGLAVGSFPTLTASAYLIHFLLFPPPADPVGAFGYGAGVATLFLLFVAPILAMLLLLVFWNNKPGHRWLKAYLVIALWFVPVLILIVAGWRNYTS